MFLAIRSTNRLGTPAYGFDGKDHYLGEYGSKKSHKRYAALIADWQARQAAAPTELSIRQLTMLYMEHCKVHYRRNGQPTTEIQPVRDALKRLNR